MSESTIPISIRRRLNKDTLSKLIFEFAYSEVSLCLDFDDEYDYADSVIDEVIDEIISDSGIDVFEEDYYSDLLDYTRELCRNWFGESLMNIYMETCDLYSQSNPSNTDLQEQISRMKSIMKS